MRVHARSVRACEGCVCFVGCFCECGGRFTRFCPVQLQFAHAHASNPLHDLVSLRPLPAPLPRLPSLDTQSWINRFTTQAWAQGWTWTQGWTVDATSRSRRRVMPLNKAYQYQKWGRDRRCHPVLIQPNTEESHVNILLKLPSRGGARSGLCYATLHFTSTR